MLQLPLVLSIEMAKHASWKCSTFRLLVAYMLLGFKCFEKLIKFVEIFLVKNQQYISHKNLIRFEHA